MDESEEKKQEINSASFFLSPAPLCLYLCNVFLSVLSWSLLSNSISPWIKCFRGGPLSHCSVSRPLIITTPSFLHPLLWVCISPLCKCSALYVKNSPYNSGATIIPSGCVQLQHLDGKHNFPWCVSEMQIDAWNIDIKLEGQNGSGFLDPADRKVQLPQKFFRAVVFQVSLWSLWIYCIWTYF